MIQEYKHKLLSGKVCLIHSDFVPAMDLFCRYLEIVKCSALITSSYRPNADNIKGAIVTPARRSNHMVGCGFDCNIIDPKGHLWNSTQLKTPIGEVLQLINLVRRSKILRWGGDFQIIDPVHFDNGINVSNPKRWDEIYAEINQPKT